MGKYTLRGSSALNDRAFKRGFEEITVLPNGIRIHLIEDSDICDTIRDYQVYVSNIQGRIYEHLYLEGIIGAREARRDLIIKYFKGSNDE